MNDLIKFQSLPPGATFYIDRHPGNVYRKVDVRTAEFSIHRLGNKYLGARLTISPAQAVRTSPMSPEELELLGIDAEAEPWMGAWTPPPEWALLGSAPAPKRKPAPPAATPPSTLPTPKPPTAAMLRQLSQDLL